MVCISALSALRLRGGLTTLTLAAVTGRAPRAAGTHEHCTKDVRIGVPTSPRPDPPHSSEPPVKSTPPHPKSHLNHLKNGSSNGTFDRAPLTSAVCRGPSRDCPRRLVSSSFPCCTVALAPCVACQIHARTNARTPRKGACLGASAGSQSRDGPRHTALVRGARSKVPLDEPFFR